jgi:hypothetical protein
MSEPNVDKKFYTDIVEKDEEEICEIIVEHTETRTKFQLCVLRTQQGKTSVAIKRIEKELEQDLLEGNGGESIHVIYTMNTLLNNKQFSKRLERIEEAYGKGSVCIFSSKYDGEYSHVKSVSKLNCICAGFDTKQVCPKVVVVCSNKKRFQDGVDFLKLINYNVKKVFPLEKPKRNSRKLDWLTRKKASKKLMYLTCTMSSYPQCSPLELLSSLLSVIEELNLTLIILIM